MPERHNSPDGRREIVYTISRRPVAQALRNRDSYEQRQARSAGKRVSAALRMARAELREMAFANGAGLTAEGVGLRLM